MGPWIFPPFLFIIETKNNYRDPNFAFGYSVMKSKTSRRPNYNTFGFPNKNLRTKTPILTFASVRSKQELYKQ